MEGAPPIPPILRDLALANVWVCSVSAIQPKNDDLSDSEDAEGSLYEDEQVEQTLAGTKRKREAAIAGPSTGTRASKRQQGKHRLLAPLFVCLMGRLPLRSHRAKAKT